MSGLVGRLAFGLASLLLWLATATTVQAAYPGEMDGTEVAGLLTPSPAASDITWAQRSPDGARITFLLQEHRNYVYGDYVAPWSCSDNWVMRADGSQLTRLTASCDLGDVYASGRSGTWWLADGSLASSYSSPVEKSGATTTRWVLASSEPTDTWTSSGFRGSLTETTPDGRYIAVTQTEWNYMNTRWWALDLETGKTHLMWDELHQGDGHWTEACATARRPAQERWTPAVGDVIGALSGDEPACTFARRPSKPKSPAQVAAPHPVDVTPPPNAVAEPPVLPASGPPSAELVPPRAATAPLVAINGVTTRRTAAMERGFRLTVATSHEGSLKVRILVPDGNGGASVIARKSLARVNGRAVVNVALHQTAKRLLRRSARVTVRASLTTPDGRRVAVERVVRLRR